MPTWNADLYLQFASERTQPSLNLINRIRLSHPDRIIILFLFDRLFLIAYR
jgi:trans-aconitate methyltransferase